MSPRHANRTDANQSELVAMARRYGALVVIIGQPLDLLVWHPRRQTWTVCEVKDPAKEGHADEFTKPQKEFIAECKRNGAEYWIWRTQLCVMRDLAQPCEATASVKDGPL